MTISRELDVGRVICADSRFHQITVDHLAAFSVVANIPQGGGAVPFTLQSLA